MGLQSAGWSTQLRKSAGLQPVSIVGMELFFFRYLSLFAQFRKELNMTEKM